MDPLLQRKEELKQLAEYILSKPTKAVPEMNEDMLSIYLSATNPSYAYNVPYLKEAKNAFLLFADTAKQQYDVFFPICKQLYEEAKKQRIESGEATVTLTLNSLWMYTIFEKNMLSPLCPVLCSHPQTNIDIGNRKLKHSYSLRMRTKSENYSFAVCVEDILLSDSYDKSQLQWLSNDSFRQLCKKLISSISEFYSDERKGNIQ